MTEAHNAYREGAAHGATPVGQVVMLYEQMVRDLRQAVKAVDESHIEGRTNAIGHAMLIVSHLQNNLNLEMGGQVARNLERFYNMVRSKLLEAQFQSSKEILNEQIVLLLDLRDAWAEVDRAGVASPVNASEPLAAAPDASGGGRSSGGWSA